MLLSCRSHYFKDVWNQNALLTGEGRDGVRAKDYHAYIVLPFNEEQIRQYLHKELGDDKRVDETMDLFAAVHNLRELARRPYLLSLIIAELGELEIKRARGEQVRGVTLYEQFTKKWLTRDQTKHHFSEAHKVILMEHIAADMWRDGAREWTWDKVEDWLDRFLHDHPHIKDRYRHLAPELLNEDFRTATFVLRPDDSKDRFRFAHTSLQEYFLALYLCHALADGHLDRWQLDIPTLETLDFLGQPSPCTAPTSTSTI